MFHRKGPWLGQIPLVLGPSSWGAGMMMPPAAPIAPRRRRRWDEEAQMYVMGQAAVGTPPYYGQWGLADGSASGQEGPFDTIDEAFNAAVAAVRKAGAQRLPDDGFAQVVDANGQGVGPVT